jgi:hypothetical protein
MEKRWDDLFALLDDRQSRPEGFKDSDIQILRTSFVAEKSRTPSAIAAARRQFLTAPATRDMDFERRFMLLADLGLTDDAFQLADRWSRAPRTEFYSTEALFSPQGTALRRDPRFIALATKLRLVDYWRATGKWPDFCVEPGLPYDCKAEAAKVAAAGRN